MKKLTVLILLFLFTQSVKAQQTANGEKVIFTEFLKWDTLKTTIVYVSDTNVKATKGFYLRKLYKADGDPAKEPSIIVKEEKAFNDKWKEIKTVIYVVPTN